MYSLQSLLQILLLGALAGGVYALMASGLTLVFGVMRIVNLCHSAAILAAAYMAYSLFLRWGLDPMLSALISIPLLFGAGWLLHRLLIRQLEGSPQFSLLTVLGTFSLALIVEGVLSYIYSGIPVVARVPYATQAYFWSGFYLPKAQLYAGVFSVVNLAVLYVVLYRTRLGRAIRAAMQNRDAAQAVGVNVTRVSGIALGIGLAMAGGAGAMMSFLYAFSPATHWVWIATLLSIVVLGGLGSLHGAVVGALLLSVAAAFVSNIYGPTWANVVFYAVLFLVLLIKPEGLFGRRGEFEA